MSSELLDNLHDACIKDYKIPLDFILSGNSELMLRMCRINEMPQEKAFPSSSRLINALQESRGKLEVR